MKKRKLELPETLPQCLYPPGYTPVVTPLAEEKSDAGGVAEKSKNQRAITVRGESENGRRPSVGGAAAVKSGKIAAETGRGKGKAKGKAKEKMKEEGGKQGGEKVGRATASVIGDCELPNKENGDSKDRTAVKNKRGCSVKATVASSVPNAMKDEGINAEYRMSTAQQARYNKMFNKLTKRKSAQTVDGAEVWCVMILGVDIAMNDSLAKLVEG